MTKYNEMTARVSRNPQPLFTTFVDAVTSAALVSDLPTPVFTPSTLANLEDVFNYSQTSTSTTNSEATYSSVPFSVNSSSTMKPQSRNVRAADSDYSDDESSCGSDYVPPSAKRSRGAYPASSRSQSPDLLDSQPLRRRRAMRADDMNLSADDYARVVQRRERNKQAAARCRQRRVDLIEKLKKECDGLETVNNNLESAIDQLRQQKDHLEFVLQAHQPMCEMSSKAAKVAMTMPKMPQQKMLLASPLKISPVVSKSSGAEEKPISRPTSLLLPRPAPKSDFASPLVTLATVTAATGIPITTPSSLLPGSLSFDLLLEGHTGLTPLVPVLATPQLDVCTPSTIAASILTSV